VILKYVIQWMRVKVRYLWKTVSQSVLVLNFDGKCWKVTEKIIQKLVLNEWYNWVKQAGGKI
jgi:hypothetical protein